MLTTETVPNLNITKRIEIVTAECAFGMNIVKDLFAGIREIVGGRSEAVQKSMRDSRKTALYELKKEAYAVGANAVVGVDLDYEYTSKTLTPSPYCAFSGPEWPRWLNGRFTQAMPERAC